MSVFKQVFLILCLLFFSSFHCLAMDERDEALLSWNTRSILSAKNVATISAEVGYRINAIHYQVGEAFTAGAVLVEFDNRLPHIRLASAKAGLDAAEAAFEATSRMLERNSASLLELETARRDSAQAQARFDEAGLELEACTIQAPFAGRVVDIMVNAHELVSRGAKIITIADDSLLLAHFIFPESQWGDVAIGDTLLLEVPLVGVNAKAVVSRISSGLDPASHTFEVWADVDNADGCLRTGMTAKILPKEIVNP